MSETLPGTVGPYRIERNLTTTAESVIVDAIDTRLDRSVWLKVLTASLDVPARERFHREARALMGIEHRNIVMLHDYSGKDEAQPYIAYEPLKGPTLRRLLTERGAMAPDVHVAYFLQLAQAIAALHAQNLAHRELSLDCVHLEDEGHVVLSGVGSLADVVSREEGTLVSRNTQLSRSPLFTAPEVQKSGVFSLSSDVYAFAVLVAAGWLGKPPMASADDTLQPDQLAGVRVTRADAPEGLVALINDCLQAKTPGLRPQMSALVEAFANAWKAMSAETPETRLYNWVRGDLKAVVDQKRQQNEARELLAQGEVDRAIMAATGGRYERIELLGQGGMGRVVRAWDTRMQRDVAIKTILDTSIDPDACMRFHREARALGRIRHPNVVEVIDYSGRGAALPFIVLELIDGANLNAVIHVTVLHELTALCVLRDLCDAVAAIHAQGLIHRDLKPENIFTEASGRVVVGDFGIVRGTEGQSSTFVRSVTHSVGSPLFSSPEQLFEVKTVSGASDMFSLGSVLYAMLYGQSPFLADGVAATLARVSEARAAPVPEGTDPFIKRLLAELLQKDPAKRPTAENVRDRVQRELSRRGVMDARQQIRLFLGSEEPESHTRIFDLAQTKIHTKITGSARDGDTNIVTSTAMKVVKAAAPVTPPARAIEKKPRRGVLWAAMGMVFITLAASGAFLGLRAKPVVDTPPPLPAPRDDIIPPPSDPIAPPSPVVVPTVPKIATPPPETSPPPRKKPSVVRIFAKPWAKVTIDGEVSGTTPVFKTTELPAGRHTFVFENPAFKTQRVVVELKAGEPQDVRVQLVK